MGYRIKPGAGTCDSPLLICMPSRERDAIEYLRRQSREEHPARAAAASVAAPGWCTLAAFRCGIAHRYSSSWYPAHDLTPFFNLASKRQASLETSRFSYANATQRSEAVCNAGARVSALVTSFLECIEISVCVRVYVYTNSRRGGL